MLSRDSSGLDFKSRAMARWRLLRDNGVELTVLVMSRLTNRLVEVGLNVQGCGGKNVWSRLWKLYFFASNEMQNTKYDLITAQDPFELGLIAYLLSKKFKKKFELQDHGGFFDGDKTDEPLWFWRMRLASWLALRADRIRTVSPKSFERLKSFGLGEKVYWLPLAAEQRFAQIARQPEPGLIVSVGRLVSVKRFDLLLKVFMLLLKNNSAFRLIIIGDGPLKNKLKFLADRLGLSAAVTFTGQTDPAVWLKRADVFVLLSAHEGWGIAAVEAALAGVPVVMTDTGCASWLEERSTVKKIPIMTKPETIALIINEASRIVSPRRLSDSLEMTTAAEIQSANWRKVDYLC